MMQNVVVLSLQRVVSYGYGISATRTVKALDQLIEQFDYRSVDDLFAGIGAGNQSIKQVVNRVSEILEERILR